MNKEFVEIAKQDDNREKIVQIMSEGNRLRNDLKNMACQIKDDLMKYSKSFDKQSVDQEKDQMAATAYFQNCCLPETKYNVAIEVIVDVDGFDIQIYEIENQFDPEFKNILLGEILSDKEYEIRYSTRVNYKDPIELEEYDKLIKILIDLFKAFDNYINNKKHGA
ncbi:MAG: hypothetical protein LBC60_03655 [Spirochaetaceae bacterium]|nr:hypothetical protein [Spirochaetaceae bacterium]